MFPISSALTTPVNPTLHNRAVSSANSSAQAVGTATDAPLASVTIDLSPVAGFLLALAHSQQQITQLQAGGSQAPQEGALRATVLSDATLQVVDAFNLLPGVDFKQSQPLGSTLLNKLVNHLTEQVQGQQTGAENLARLGVTLQPALLSDRSGGLSLDNEVLRAAFHSNEQNTTSTLQDTLTNFRKLATDYAEQLSATASTSLSQLAPGDPAALSPAEQAQNARLDFARAQFGLLLESPLSETGAARLALQRAALEQPPTPTSAAPESPTVNPLFTSTSAAIVAQNKQALQTQQAELAQQAQQALQAPQTALAQQQALQGINYAQMQQAALAEAADLDTRQSAQAQQDLPADHTIAAQQDTAADTTATGSAAASAAAADAALQARAAQAAAAEAAAMQANPLQGNPALAAAIAAYHINDPTLGNHTPRAVQSQAPAVGRVTAVTAADRVRSVGA